MQHMCKLAAHVSASDCKPSQLQGRCRAHLSCCIQWLQSFKVRSQLPGATFSRLLYMLSRKKASLLPLITSVGTVMGCPIALHPSVS